MKGREGEKRKGLRRKGELRGKRETRGRSRRKEMVKGKKEKCQKLYSYLVPDEDLSSH